MVPHQILSVTYDLNIFKMRWKHEHPLSPFHFKKLSIHISGFLPNLWMAVIIGSNSWKRQSYYCLSISNPHTASSLRLSILLNLLLLLFLFPPTTIWWIWRHHKLLCLKVPSFALHFQSRGPSSSVHPVILTGRQAGDEWTINIHTCACTA